MIFLNTLFAIGIFILTAGSILAADGNTGTVAETIDVDSYIYIRLEEDSAWLATTPLEVAVGDRIEYSTGFLLKDFHSAALDRDFAEIRFVERVQLEGAEGAGTPQGHPHTAAATENSMDFMKSETASAPVAGEILRAEGGKTVAEVLAESDSLAGQAVQVRARVIKVSSNILGKNWITLQDGSGTEGDSKLIATTTEEVSVGDVLLVGGKIKTNVDIGSGYKYKVVLEEATFSR